MELTAVVVGRGRRAYLVFRTAEYRPDETMTLDEAKALREALDSVIDVVSGAPDHGTIAMYEYGCRCAACLRVGLEARSHES